MVESKYNYVVKLEAGGILLNSLTGNVCFLPDNILRHILSRRLTQMEKEEGETTKKLIERGYILQNNCAEITMRERVVKDLFKMHQQERDLIVIHPVLKEDTYCRFDFCKFLDAVKQLTQKRKKYFLPKIVLRIEHIHNKLLTIIEKILHEGFSLELIGTPELILKIEHIRSKNLTLKVLIKNSSILTEMEDPFILQKLGDIIRSIKNTSLMLCIENNLQNEITSFIKFLKHNGLYYTDNLAAVINFLSDAIDIWQNVQGCKLNTSLILRYFELLPQYPEWGLCYFVGRGIIRSLGWFLFHRAKVMPDICYCEAGSSLFIFDYQSYSIFPCWNVVSDINCAIGSYLKGVEFNEEQLQRWKDLGSRIFNKCIECPIFFICQGGCKKEWKLHKSTTCEINHKLLNSFFVNLNEIFLDFIKKGVFAREG